MNDTTRWRHALMLIEASGFNGLSRDVLMHALIHPATLTWLEARHFVELREHRFAKPAMLILRYHITDAGRVALRVRLP